MSSSSSSSSALHVGVLPFPSGSHTIAMLTLVKRLAVSLPGAQFSFFSPCSRRSLFMDPVSNSYENIKLYDVWDGTTQQGFLGNHIEELTLFVNATPGNFQMAIEESERDVGLKVSCFIIDVYFGFAGELAEKRQAKWFGFWTTACGYLSPFMHAEEIKKVMGSDSKAAAAAAAISIIPGFEHVDFSDLPVAFLSDENVPVMAKVIKDGIEKLPKCDGVISISFDELSPIITDDLKTKFKHYLNIGPLILSSPTTGPADRTGCLAWLDNQNRAESVVYISFGTVIQPPEEEFVALAEALETTGIPFLWSLKDEARKLLPHGFLQRTCEQGRIVKWAPQIQVLEHKSVGVFITHGGWSSILEGICSSVPMICRPIYGDQRMNGRMVQDTWKIGVRLNGGVFTKSGTIEALNLVMSGESGKRIRENIHLLRHKAGKAVKQDGSSTKNYKALVEIIGK